MKAATFDHPARAKVASEIMKMYGVITVQVGVLVQEAHSMAPPRGGFEFFARLYDANQIST